MRNYIVQRLLAAIPTIFGITILIFLAMRVLPGDPFLAVGGESATTMRMTEEQIRQARAQLGIDRPYWQQYLSWMADIARGELGRSFWRDEPVRDLIMRRAPISAEIAILAMILAWLVGIPLGVLSATRTNTVAGLHRAGVCGVVHRDPRLLARHPDRHHAGADVPVAPADHQRRPLG